jgi:hypothetical protein
MGKKLSEKMLADVATMPHVKKIWVKGDDYHLNPKAGWDEHDVNGAEESAEEYSKWTVAELLTECASREIATTKDDKKADLVKALEDNDAGLD